jgi:pyruvate dehydrogenase E2 component (dihydrolipoamide acetyltransferase)
MAQLMMPKMGDGMEEGTIRKWLKSEGDKVAEQETIAEIDTEKATIEIPSTEAGVLTRILVKEGDTVPVGTPIAEVGGPSGGASAGAAQAAPQAGGNGQAKAAPAPPQPSPPQQAQRQQPEPRRDRGDALADREQVPGDNVPTPQTTNGDLEHGPATGSIYPELAGAAPTDGGRVKASPLAKKVAAEHGVDLSGVQGTGPGGRIVEADVEEALRRGPGRMPAQPAAKPAGPAQPAAATPSLAGTERPMSTMRKVIARRLTQSKQTIPHFYLTLDVDMRAAARLRSEYNAGAGDDRKASFNDLVIRACVLALEKYPAVNSRLEEETIKTPAAVNLGVAVSLEEGLIVPVIRDAQNKSISVIGREVRQLAERARNNQLTPAEYSGGTFTVSNLGMFDITLFQAVINPPEAAILAVGAIRETPVVDNGQVVPGKQMYLTLSVDHRIVDGQVGAIFMQEVKRLLEAPMSLFG